MNIGHGAFHFQRFLAIKRKIENTRSCYLFMKSLAVKVADKKLLLIHEDVLVLWWRKGSSELFPRNYLMVFSKGFELEA